MNPTPDWLATTLNKSIDSLGVELIGQFSSEASRLHLVGDALPASLILKRPGNRPSNRIGESFVMEEQFYGAVAPHLKIRLPTCYGYADD